MIFLAFQVSKGGFENILVVTYHSSRYAQAHPTKKPTRKNDRESPSCEFCSPLWMSCSYPFGPGAQLKSDLIKDLCDLAGIAKSRTTRYHPMGNRTVERFNQTILKMLVTLDNHQKSDWKSPCLVIGSCVRFMTVRASLRII